MTSGASKVALPRRRSMATWARAWSLIALAMTITTALLTASSSPTSAAGTSIPSGPITFGAILPMSGSQASYGKAFSSAAKAAIRVVNSEGGIAGHKVSLNILDDSSDPSTAEADARQLVSDHVVALVAGSFEPMLDEVTPITNAAKVPLIGPADVNMYANGKKWPYVYSDYIMPQDEGHVFVDWVKKKGYKKVGILVSNLTDNLQTASGIAQGLKGVATVTKVQVPSTATNLSVEVSQLKNAGDQAILGILTSGYEPLYSALTTMSWSPPFATLSDAYFNPLPSKKVAAKSLVQCTYALPAGVNPTSTVKRLQNAYKSIAGSITPDSIIQTGMELNAVLALKGAIQTKRSTSGPKIAQYLNSLHNKAFMQPQWKLSFTAANHSGWPADQSYLCKLSPTGAYGIPTIAFSG